MEESQEKVVLATKDDISNIENFFSHFKLPLPKYLQDQIDVWKSNPEGFNEDNQKEMVAALSRAVLESDHEIFSNDVWKGILKECDETYYNSQFDKDLQEALSAEEEDNG